MNNTNAISKRLEAIERTVGTAQGIADLPRPLDTLSASDQALVTAYRAARHGGDGEPVDTPEAHAAMRRYVQACAAYDDFRSRAGVMVRSPGETIRERLAEIRRNHQEAA